MPARVLHSVSDFFFQIKNNTAASIYLYPLEATSYAQTVSICIKSSQSSAVNFSKCIYKLKWINQASKLFHINNLQKIQNQTEIIFDISYPHELLISPFIFTGPISTFPKYPTIVCFNSPILAGCEFIHIETERVIQLPA